MSDEKRQVPTEPGWWWVRTYDGDVAVLIERHVRRGLVCHYGDTGYNVTGGLHWLAPVLTPAEADALRAERDDAVTALAGCDEALTRARDERDRYREAVGRLRAVLEQVTEATSNAWVHEAASDALAATTDEAIQGYDEPPVPDAVLVAKANAALVAEVAELRAERDAAAREADGLRFVAFETEKALGEALTALDLFSTLASQVGNVKSAALGRVLDARERVKS